MSKEQGVLFTLKSIFSKDPPPPPPEKQVQSNPINELQILTAHTDIVRIVLKIDETRLASASDDATIVIWNFVIGERLSTLLGHKMPITCLLMLDRNVLISGSSDRTIRMWDLSSSTCTRVLRHHQGSIRALYMLPKGMFCSGANDRHLCVWSLDGELVSKIERQEEENLHCLISVSDEWVVTSSNSQFLLAYNISSQIPFKILVYHRESVQCLVRISDKFFASASLDGCLVVWHTDTFTPRVLAFPENYRSQEHIFIYSVHYLLPLGEAYLVVAIGKRVELYDVVTGDCVLECDNTHESTITCMIALYGGTKLLTSSADSSIKIWDLPNLTQLNTSATNAVMSPKRQRKKKSNHPTKAACAGEMWGHTDGVYCMTSLTETSLASCGGDGTVVIWKDGQVQSDMRNNYATVSLLRYTSSLDDEFQDEQSDSEYQYEEANSDTSSVNEFGSLSMMDNSRTEQDVSYDDHIDYETHYRIDPSLYPIVLTSSTQSPLPPFSPALRSASPTLPPLPTLDPPLLSRPPSPFSLTRSGSGSGTLKRVASGSMNVPEDVFKYAEMLRIEKKMPLQNISEQLQEEGYSEQLIVAVMQKQVLQMEGDIRRSRDGTN